jgi:hypothetical protein
MTSGSDSSPKAAIATPKDARAAPKDAAATAGAIAAAAPRLAALLLGAACVAWTATPLRHSGLAGTVLAVAIVAVTASALRLALSEVPQPEDEYLLPAPVRAWLVFLAALRLLPWEEIAVVALLWLEVLHPARPWHTAALGAGLVAYLLAVHIAESGAEPGRLLRRQAKVLVAGACLLALGAGFAMLPAAGPGAGSALLRVLAAAAVIAAAALVLPA